MALTYTPPAELGQKYPTFELPDVHGKVFRSTDFSKAKALVIAFICNHCPYVRAIEDRLIQLGHYLDSQGGCLVGICSNDAGEYPEDSIEQLRLRWQQKNYAFVYLHDAEQKVARLFGAACTPDFFVYDSKQRLCYRGRLDDSWKDSSRVQKEELKIAVDCVLSNQAPPLQQIPSMGCSIKWRQGV